MDGFIDELSKHIGGDWKKLARKLGLSKTDIDAVYYDNLSSLEEQIFQFFDKWKQKTGMNATEKLLIDGLKAAKLNETLQKLLKAGFLPKDEQCTQSSSKHLQQTSKPSVTCGACGQKGHTKRSKDCPFRDEKCYCGEPVVERTVTKEGKNKGRVFYACCKPEGDRCGYFRFAEDERPPLCKCQLLAVRRTVTREGKNKGRVFYACCKPEGDRCGYFKFQDKKLTTNTKTPNEELKSGKTSKSQKRGNPRASRSAPTALKKPRLEEKKSLTINIHTAQNVTISSSSK